MNSPAKKADIERACPALKALAGQLAAMVTLVNEIRGDHNAHCANTGSHTTADTINVTTSPVVDSL